MADHLIDKTLEGIKDRLRDAHFNQKRDSMTKIYSEDVAFLLKIIEDLRAKLKELNEEQ